MSKSLFPSPKILWTAHSQSVQCLDGSEQIPGPWKLMLLGDGSPTLHLRLLTGSEVRVELIGMESDSHPEANAPIEIEELEPPLLKRQVWLICGSDVLAWAESWWNIKEAESHLKKKHQPIWQSLTQGRSELFREVDGLALVNADWLEEKFGIAGPFWSRHYRFFRNQRELTVIREVFNPKLESWLGSAPRQNSNSKIS